MLGVISRCISIAAMSSHTHLQSIWRVNKMILRIRSTTLVNRKQKQNLRWSNDHEHPSVARLFSNRGKKSPVEQTVSHEKSGGTKARTEEASGVVTTDETNNTIGRDVYHDHDNLSERDSVNESKKFHSGIPTSTLNSQLTSVAYENDQDSVDNSVKKRKKKKPLSAMMKVIMDKKMLERYQESSKRRKGKSSGSAIPVIHTSGGGFKDQLLEYISRHDETWENVDNAGKRFAVSKSGRVMMFPLTNSDVPSEKFLESNSEVTKLPSVTSILHVTRPMKQALALMKWEKRMIAELGEDGFKQMKQDMFAQGHSIHSTFEKYLKGTFTADVDLSSETVGFWESGSEVLPRIRNPTGFEIKVKHPALSYTGYLDCVAEVDGKLTLIEWKTSRKPKLELKYSEDYALQAVAYLGALNFDPEHTFQVDQIMIVVVYKDGMTATVHTLDEEACNHYWIKWLERLLEYHEIADMKKAYVKRKIIAWSKTKATEKKEESV